MDFDELSTMSLERLCRKRDQAYDMAGLARIDRDYKDEERRLKEAATYDAEIIRRAGLSRPVHPVDPPIGDVPSI